MGSAPETAIDQFFGGFYRSPVASIAVEAFHAWVVNPGRDPEGGARMFVRAIQLFPAVREGFDTLGAQSRQAAALLHAASEASFPDPATAPLAQPADVDFQWAEFLLTGSREPVLRITAVLSREDRIRVALTAWANEKVYLPWTRTSRATRRQALAARGITLPPEPPGSDKQLDLDLVAWKLMAGGWKIREELPVTVDQGFVMHLAVKGSACWSLQSNARSHPVVREVYDSLAGADRFPQMA